MRETINGADLRRMIISAAAAIEINKQALNELNVFPVPDGDTGTNMSMTINSAASDLRKTEDPDLEIQDITAEVQGCGFTPFEGATVKAVAVDNFTQARKWIDKLLADVEVDVYKRQDRLRAAMPLTPKQLMTAVPTMSV